MHAFLLRLRVFFSAILLTGAACAWADVGLAKIPGKDGDGPVTIYYPSSSTAEVIERGPFVLRAAWQGSPVRGNGRLIVISHGSGGSPWEFSDLARTLVEAGFVVAMPEHRGDNYKDPSEPGPQSWKRRPLEVSRAIDAVAQDQRFGPLLSLDKVGMYGMSAGGHTALTLAGGRWSPAQLERHCEAHIADDFQGCVGLATRLTGGMFDGLKKRIALSVIRMRLDDGTWYTHQDPRIAAIVAGVPFASDFDPSSLSGPGIPLALITARQDKWLIPRYHSDPILRACGRCVLLTDFSDGGHGALLSPLPPNLPELLGELLADPPGFDRARLPEVDCKIATFFEKHLLP